MRTMLLATTVLIVSMLLASVAPALAGVNLVISQAASTPPPQDPTIFDEFGVFQRPRVR